MPEDWTKSRATGGSDAAKRVNRMREVRWRSVRYSLFALRHSPTYLNLFERGNPFGGSRPASARLPRQSDSSFRVSEKLRPAPSVQVRPSLPLKVFTSDRPPSL